MSKGTTKLLLDVVKAAMWDGKFCVDDMINYEVYEELCKHAIAVLPATVISRLNMPSELRSTWRELIIRHYSYYCRYQYSQSNLPIQVPYIILKGTSAAQYYPHPEFRTMGDIDIITRREDYCEACSMLLENGYREVTAAHESKNGRHRSFEKDGIHVEVHLFFSLLNDTKQAKFLDDLIIQNINSSHILQDQINGLVLLEHINQHLEDGLGLRQIIDWMMFVDKYMQDQKWPGFQLLTEKIGLTTLAVITTRMCEIFLGLTEHDWCKDADTNLCKQLMDYVLCCGNFGNKRTSDSDIGENVFAIATSPKAAYNLLQTRGLINWKASQKYHFLRPFAWLYQTWRYVVKGIGREGATSKLRKEYKSAQKRNRMLDSLGVRKRSKGQIVFQNGEYEKK